MPPRLTELFRPGDRVELLFSDASEEHWAPAEVVALQHPGVWARAADGHLWFVTNARHIRPLAAPPAPPSS